jgi:tetratricopeptide (TPR) repeat protein
VQADRAVLVHQQGRHQEAWRMFEESRATLAGRLDMLNGWQLTQRHAELLIASGRAADAADRLRPAIEQVSAMVGLQQPATQLLVVLAGAYLGHDPRQAADAAGEAVEAARKGQFLLLEGQALTVLAQALHRLGRSPEALEAATEALGVHEETGHEPGRDETAALLAELNGPGRAGLSPAGGPVPPVRRNRTLG